jgi:3-hydroxyacyl-[acyl-carrier-protein] dehydratase
MTASVVGRFAIPAHHPSLPGHFPDNPIVPGVLLLDHVMALIVDAGSRIVALPTVKFIAVVRPDDTVEVTAGASAGRIDFSARCDGRLVLRGTAETAVA